MSVITKDFTAVGAGPHNLVRHLGTLRYQVEGTFVGTVVVERSRDGGLSWKTIATTSAAADVTLLVEDEGHQDQWWRFRCSAFTSGTIETTLTSTDPSSDDDGGGDGGTHPVDLASDVTGVLPVANGGTSSSTALVNDRVMISSGGDVVEADAITASRVLISDASGIPTHSSVTSTTLAFLDATSSIQTQINTKAPSTSPTFATSARFNYATASTVPYLDSNKDLVSSSVTPTELGYLSGVTSAIQTQLGAKIGGGTGSTDNALLRADGTGGATAQGSAVTCADTTGVIRFPTDGGLEFNGAANPSIKSLTSFEAGTMLANTGATNRSHFWQVNSVTKFGITNSDAQVYGSVYAVGGTQRLGYTAESSLPAPFAHAYFQQMWVDEGTNKSQGLATLVGGTVTVNTTQVLTGDRVVLIPQTPGGTQGHLSLGTITNATSFVINSSSGTDTSTVFWMIYHPY